MFSLKIKIDCKNFCEKDHRFLYSIESPYQDAITSERDSLPGSYNLLSDRDPFA